MADTLQHNPVIIALTSTGWTAALIAILHYSACFVLVGSMVVVDLSVLNVLGRGANATGIAKRLFPGYGSAWR